MRAWLMALGGAVGAGARLSRAPDSMIVHDFPPRLTKPSISLESANWYQTPPETIKHRLLNQLATTSYCVGQVKLSPRHHPEEERVAYLKLPTYEVKRL